MGKVIIKCVAADVIALLILWIATLLIAEAEYREIVETLFFINAFMKALIYFVILWLITCFIYKKTKANIFVWHLNLMLPGIFFYLGFLILYVGLSGPGIG